MYGRVIPGGRAGFEEGPERLVFSIPFWRSPLIAIIAAVTVASLLNELLFNHDDFELGGGVIMALAILVAVMGRERITVSAKEISIRLALFRFGFTQTYAGSAISDIGLVTKEILPKTKGQWPPGREPWSRAMYFRFRQTVVVFGMGVKPAEATAIIGLIQARLERGQEKDGAAAVEAAEPDYRLGDFYEAPSDKDQGLAGVQDLPSSKTYLKAPRETGAPSSRPVRFRVQDLGDRTEIVISRRDLVTFAVLFPLLLALGGLWTAIPWLGAEYLQEDLSSWPAFVQIEMLPALTRVFPAFVRLDLPAEPIAWALLIMFAALWLIIELEIVVLMFRPLLQKEVLMITRNEIRRRNLRGKKKTWLVSELSGVRVGKESDPAAALSKETPNHDAIEIIFKGEFIPLIKNLSPAEAQAIAETICERTGIRNEKKSNMKDRERVET